ncbi:MAG: hypothetical protein ABIL09_08195 [Gemmatimonadota bacterium]
MPLLTAAEAAAPEGGGLPVSPAVVLVFGFVSLIVLQAGFVRRLTHLRARSQECKTAYDKLREEVVSLSEQVSSLDRAVDSNGVSILALERETESLQKQIDTFLAEHPKLAEALAAEGAIDNSAPAGDHRQPGSGDGGPVAGSEGA